MDRSIRFEVQYLLSTIVVILGILGVSSDTTYANEYIGVLFVLVIILHLIFLNTYYAFSQISQIESPYLDDLRAYSEVTLFGVSMMLVYFFLHVIVTMPPDFIGPLLASNLSIERNEILTKYLNVALPILPTVAMGLGFWTVGLPTFRLSRNLSINLIPDELKIYPDYSDQRSPMMFEVRNSGSDEYSIELSMDLPDGVVAREANRMPEYEGDEFTKSADISAGERLDFQFEFRHDRSQRGTVAVDFDLTNEAGSLEDSVLLYLR